MMNRSIPTCTIRPVASPGSASETSTIALWTILPAVPMPLALGIASYASIQNGKNSLPAFRQIESSNWGLGVPRGCNSYRFRPPGEEFLHHVFNVCGFGRSVDGR